MSPYLALMPYTLSLLLSVVFLLPFLSGRTVAACASQASTLAGTGVAGFSGDGGPASAAQLNNPYGVARGPDGALYVCDIGNHRVRRIDRDGTITTVVGNGTAGYAGDGGPATSAALNEPYEVRFDRRGDLYFVEMKNHLVRKVDRKTGRISTVAGTGQPGFSGDEGPAARARFNQPHAIQFDPRGEYLYVCDIANHRLRRIEMSTGTITTFAGDGTKRPTPDGAQVSAALPLNGPRAIDFDAAGDLWLALREGNAVYRVDMKAGTIHHAAGTGKSGFTGNGGPAKEATLSGPKGIAVGPDGNVYLADTESHSVRRIVVKSGTLELVAGTGKQGNGADGDGTRSRFARPHGIFVDSDGSIVVGDSENHRVRIVQMTRSVK